MGRLQIAAIPGGIYMVGNTFPDPSFSRPMDQPTLSGSHVRLVPLSLDHVPALCEVGLDPEIWRWTPSNVDTLAGMRAFVTEALAERDAGRAVLLVSAELGEVMALSDRILVMYEGRILAEAPPAQADEQTLGLLMAGRTPEAA